MFRHLWDFALSVIQHWVALVTGCFVIAAIVVWERYRKKPIAGWLFWTVIGVFLVSACFLAWQDERLKVEHLTSNRISLTPKEIIAVFEGRTTIQGDELASIYLGKWTDYSGTINDIGSMNFGLSAGTYVSFKKDNFTDPLIMARGSSAKWNKQLSMLRSGDKIKVGGHISKIYKDGLWLDDGEIIELPH